MLSELKSKISLISFFLLLIVVNITPPVCAGNSSRSNTLFIFSWHKDMPWQMEIEKGFKDRIRKKPYEPNLFFEYLDAGRFKSVNQLAIFRNYLEKKYAATKIDNVIYESADASRLFKTYPELFQSSKKFIVNPGPAFDKSPNNSSIIIPVHHDLKKSMRKILKLNQGKTIYLIAGATKPSQERVVKVTERILEIDPARKIVPLVALPMKQLLETVSKLNPASLIIYLLIFQDGEGVHYIPYDAAEQISRHANAPVYSLWTSLMGSGIIGGYLLSGEKVGQEIAAILADPNHVRNADEIDSADKFQGIFWDWRQLERWHIKENQLPEGSTILFKEPAFYEHYHEEMIFFSLVIIVIITVIWNRKLNKEISERRKIEQQLLESEDKYKSLSDAAFEGIVISDKGVILESNKIFSQMFGYASNSELVGMTIFDLVIPEDRDEVQKNILAGYEKPYEISGLRKDNSKFPIEACGKMFYYRNQEVRVSAIRDLTEKKNSEEEIKSLKNVLPICMHCKGIRDDKGYWNQLEKYLEKHSGTQFSHGICDKCLNEKYPESED